MGYLAVLAGSFLVSLVGTAMVLAVLARNFWGGVPEWVLPAALFIAFMASWTAAYWYEGPRHAPHG